ncbi:MAG: diadenylate cyclase CdaA [Bacteroidota bacterium]
MILLFKIGFLEVSWVDILDVTMVTILLYQVYKLMKGSVAIKIFLGILALYLIFLFVQAAQMELLSIILGQFMGVGVIAAIIVFQQEIRKFLLLVGKTTEFNREGFLKGLMVWKKKEGAGGFLVTPVIEAAKTLGGTNSGALIVFSRDSELKFYAESGDIIDAEISKRLILAIFNKQSPLHDGAAIIHKGRIKAARCILPVTENSNLPAQFGLRHRAAIGMSEVTDTLVLVVSEETGQMSIVQNGKIFHNLSALEIRKKINEYLFEDQKVTEKDQKSSETKESSSQSSISEGNSASTANLESA